MLNTKLLLIRMCILAACAVIACLLLAGCSRLRADRAAYQLTSGGDSRRGRDAIRNYGCFTCHTVPGVDGASGLVGPPLTNIASRVYIAGELPNRPDNLMRWIQHPRQVEPGTAMPEMGVTEQDSRDIAAYLYTLR
jgi:cytochrome c